MRRAASALVAAALLGHGCAGGPGAAPAPRSDVAAASRLPEYAKPQAEVRDFAKQPPPEGIPYRTLAREDFRSATPPPHVGPHAERMGAATCAIVVPARSMGIRVRQDASTGGRFVAEPARVGFEAQMDPACSWWNPKSTGRSPEYVLQHEQIHFAITEIEARDLTHRVRLLSASEASASEAQAALQRALDAELVRTRDRIVERNLAFDEETSARYVPEAQQRWWQRMQAELARGR
jgi:hypothetical protein